MNLTVMTPFLPFTSKRSVVNLAKFSETFTERKRGQDSSKTTGKEVERGVKSTGPTTRTRRSW